MAIDEGDSGPVEAEGRGFVEASPALLGHPEELAGHRQAPSPGPRSFRHPLPKGDRGEAGFDGVSGADVPPVLGCEVLERQEPVLIRTKRGHRLRVLGPVLLFEPVDLLLRFRPCGGLSDLLQGLLGLWLKRGRVKRCVKAVKRRPSRGRCGRAFRP